MFSEDLQAFDFTGIDNETEQHMHLKHKFDDLFSHSSSIQATILN